MKLLHCNHSKPSAVRVRHAANAAFTLVEVLVSMVILAMMMLIITSVISQAQRSWKAASSRVSQFREARLAFDTITRNLRQASMDSHREFRYSADRSFTKDPLEPPTGIVRVARLGIKFGTADTLVSGGGGGANNLPGHAVVFQAPIGKTALVAPNVAQDKSLENLKNLLCVRGYFVQFGTNATFLPAGLASKLEAKNRYRLFEYQPVAENNTVYDTNSEQGWAQIKLDNPKKDLRPVAENILMLGLAVSFTPATSTATPSLAGTTAKDLRYGYDSYNDQDPAMRFRLPRYVQVFMIAMDEESAARLEQKNGSSAPDSVRASGAQFTDASKLFGAAGDLTKVRDYMDKERLNYRIFNASVLILGSES